MTSPQPLPLPEPPHVGGRVVGGRVDDGLAAALGVALGGTVTGLRRLLGGASRETWAFTLDGRPLVLRRDPPGAPRAGAMEREAALLTAAANVGVPVPDVVAADDRPGPVGSSYLVMQWLDGETLARRILRDDAYARARSVLTQQCGRALAQLHTLHPDEVPGLPLEDPVGHLRAVVDEVGEPHPAFELALRWLEQNRPPPLGPVVVHGDFRNGNLMVGPEGLVSVLDWELAHAGDPREDLGWLCVRSWRFGAPLPVGGFGTREDLLAGYAAAGGAVVGVDDLRWFEVLGTLRWGTHCELQAQAHLSGAVRSVELAAIGRRVCEVELDLLDLLPTASAVAGTDESPATEPVDTGQPPHDRPTAVELLEAVREWLQTDVAPEVEGRTRFMTRVASRVLGQVQRELLLGPGLAAVQRDRLRTLGYADDAELAAAVRAGRAGPEVAPAVRAAVVDKLRVADPGQLTGR